jgi:hypothetical protein
MVTAENTTPEAVTITAPKQSFFKFGVYLNGQLINERLFRADVYNPPIRNNINLRPLAPKIMSELQYALRQPDYRITQSLDTSNGKLVAGTFGQPTYFAPRQADTLNYPEVVESALQAEGDNSFSFSLKINDKFIIERNFKVAKFNPNTLFSTILDETVNYWAEEIQLYIKDLDTRFMWEEYELSNTFNLTPVEVRALAPDKRELMLRRIQGPAAPTV